jgi:hypothetical protein
MGTAFKILLAFFSAKLIIFLGLTKKSHSEFWGYLRSENVPRDKIYFRGTFSLLGSIKRGFWLPIAFMKPSFRDLSAFFLGYAP